MYSSVQGPGETLSLSLSAFLPLSALLQQQKKKETI
jgi:hypothetical protein